MSDEKEKIEKIEAPEVGSKKIEKKEKKKDKKEGKKHRKGLVVAVIILAVLLALVLPGASLFIVALCNSNPFTARGVITEQHAESTVVDDDEYESYERIEEEVEGVLKAIREKNREHDQYNVPKEIEEDSGFAVYHKINDNGVLYHLGRSLSLHFPFGNKSFKEISVNALLDIGFTEYAHINNGIQLSSVEVDNVDTFYAMKSGENGLDIVCAVGLFSVDCGNESWKGSDEWDVVKLVEAYKNSTGKVLETVRSFTLDWWTTNMNESGYGYRTARIRAYDIDDDHENTFYFYGFGSSFASPSDWVYAFKEYTFCSEISDEAKKAFESSGVTCLNSNSDGTYSDGNIVSL